MLIDTAEIERIGGRAKNPDIDAALRILETNGLILGDQTICPACGQPWTGEPCGQKDNGWPFPVCYPASNYKSVADETERCARIAETVNVPCNGHPQIDAPTINDARRVIAEAIRKGQP